jgi:excisionase family DNA binding protein
MSLVETPETARAAVFTVPEVAAELHVSPKTVYRWIALGQLTAVRVGPARTIRIPRSAVDELVRVTTRDS